jgi:hypothetical protein
MRARYRSVPVALVVMLVSAALACASASAALPEFSPKPPGAGEAIRTIVGGLTIQDSQSALRVTCSGGTGEGLLTGVKTLTEKLVLKECGASGVSCHSEGALAGEVKTGELLGNLVYTSKANKEVGIDLKGQPLVMSILCGSERITIREGAIGKITPVNISKKEFTLSFAYTSEAWQVPSYYENESGGHIADTTELSFLEGPYVRSGLGTTIELSLKESYKIKA